MNHAYLKPLPPKINCERVQRGIIFKVGLLSVCEVKVKWPSQGLPGWAKRKPGRLSEENKESFKKKYEKLQEKEETLSKYQRS